MIYEVQWSENVRYTRWVEASTIEEALDISRVIGRASHTWLISPLGERLTIKEYNLTEMKARRIDPKTLDKDTVVIVGGAYAGEHEDGSGPYIGFSTVDAGAFQPRRR